VKSLFTLGHVVATPGALAAIEKSGQQPGEFLARRASGLERRCKDLKSEY